MPSSQVTPARQSAFRIVEVLQNAGHEAYWVGGCVRDALFGLEPEDYDVATSAAPDTIAALFAMTRDVGRSFAVMQVCQDDIWVEVSTFRAESDYSDARHPDAVTPTDVRTDAERRDFTINALYYDPIEDRHLDFVDGRADIERRVLRCVGDPGRRLREDALRLLRAVRFACRFDLVIEPATLKALGDHAARLRHIARERVRDEFLALITGPRPGRALTLLFDTRLLRHVAPELERLRGCEQSPRHHPEGDVWVHTLRMLDRMAERSEPDVALALGVLLHDVGKPATRKRVDGEWVFHRHEQRGQEIAAAWMHRLAIPRRTQEQVQMLIGSHMQFLNVQRMRKSTLRRFLLQPDFARLLELHRLDALSSRGDLTHWEWCRRALQEIQDEGVPVRPLLDGEDLIALGYEPGPRFGTILRTLLDAQLEGNVADREAARAWVLEHFPRATQGEAPPGDEVPGGPTQ